MVDTKKLLVDDVRAFNAADEENVIQAIPNAGAEAWLMANAPRITIPDKDIERTYYFRLWTYRKHLQNTPEGIMISEFHPDVSWAGKYNTISGTSPLHIREGRWMRDNTFLDDYIHFWFTPDGMKRLNDYSNALEASIASLAKLRGDRTGWDLLTSMEEDFAERKRELFTKEGLYWNTDNRDGGEYAVSGSGLRVLINTCQYANAMAIAEFARRCGDEKKAGYYADEANALKKRINEVLWDEEKRFYINVPQDEIDGEVSRLPVRRVRELYGYMPWAYGAEEKGRTDAFRQLFDPEGFFGKRGITTTERRSEGYGIFYTGEELNQWRRIRLIAGTEEGCRAE